MSLTLATPVYNIGGWQGNVTDDYGVDWVVEGEDGWSASPPVRAMLKEKTAGDGSWAGPGNYASRVISLTGSAMAADQLSMMAAKARLKAAVNPRALLTLQVDDIDVSRTCAVRLSDQVSIVDKGARKFTWGLTLVAPDPRRYAAQTQSQSTGLPTSAGGRTYPRTYPVLYGGPTEGGSGSVYITQAGDYDETPATIVITGPVISPTVAHVGSGRALTFNLTLAEAETLVIDLGAGSALLNGLSSRGGTITPGSAWFMLTPGVNEIQFRGQDPGTGSTTPVMTVTAASAWT